MKNLFITLFITTLILSSCKSELKNDKTYVSFGDKIDTENVISNKELTEKYNSMKIGDTLNLKVSGKIANVCQKKGCWITVPLNDGKESFVKFKDYAFFMPMNSAGSNIILNGKAFINEIPVATLRHYAEDAGKPKEEIEKITEPKITYSFLADGVLLESKPEEKVNDK